MKIETINQLHNLTSESADLLSQCRYHLIGSRRPFMDAVYIEHQKEMAFSCWQQYTEKQIELAKVQYAHMGEIIFYEVENEVSHAV